MNTRRNAARRLEEEVSNAEAPPHGDQVPPLEEDANVEQAPANPPPMMETEMRDIISQIDQAINTQSQDTTVKAQAMKTHANRDISPLPYQQVTTMDSHLRYSSRMNPPTFYGSKVD